MNRLLMLLSAVLVAVAVSAQDIYRPILDEIEKNNPQIKLYEKTHEATLAENATSLAPANPEVEFGYLWGSRLTGDRKDISVSQAFDFPTVYGQRSHLSRQKDAAAAYLLKSQRLELLLEAKLQLVQLVYVNALRSIVTNQLDYARQIKEAYSQLIVTGQATKIDYNKAVLNFTDFENMLSRLDMERSQILERLTGLNGGNPVKEFDFAEFCPEPLPADFEQWFAEAEQQTPALHYLKSQVDVSLRNVALEKALRLPKFSVGYQGEYVLGSNFSGVKVGVSIPLWENRNKVRHARKEAEVAQATLADAKTDYYYSLKSLYQEAATLAEMESRYKASLQEASNQTLLFKAFSFGQLSMVDYVTEVQYDFTLREKLLATQRDRQLAMTRLYSFAL